MNERDRSTGRFVKADPFNLKKAGFSDTMYDLTRDTVTALSRALTQAEADVKRVTPQ
jgi:hypothetical protein